MMVASRPSLMEAAAGPVLAWPAESFAAPDLLTHWELRERPFEPTWDTRFFFQAREHAEALSRLAFLVGEQTMLFGMLTGEVGCGKTLTRAVFTGHLDPQQFCVITLENSSFSFTELLGLVLRELGADPADLGRTKFARCDRFRRAVQRLAAEQRHLVLVFDEAQEMSAAILNELKLLTNLNGAGQNPLTVILVGQPELRERVGQLPAIDQRVSLRFHLNALSPEESGDYLRHRLRVAGHATGELFTPEAVERAYQSARGVPRELNRIAKLALEFAWVNDSLEVAPDAVEAVVRDLKRYQSLPRT